MTQYTNLESADVNPTRIITIYFWPRFVYFYKIVGIKNQD
jgi:hypothetical protein